MRLNPKNDFLFKRLFGEEESKHLLMALLNAILRRDGRPPITNIALVEDTSVAREFEDEKEAVLDIVCELDHREMVNVEMQIARFTHMNWRSLFYVGKLLTKSLRLGQTYGQLKRSIGVNLLDHAYVKLDQYHTTFHLYEDHLKEFMLTDLLELHFIEFPKFRSVPFDLTDPLHRWLRFLEQETTNEQMEELMMMDDMIKEAEARLQYLASDVETRRRYEMREKMLHDRASWREDALEEGRKEGLEEGRQKGTEQESRRIAEDMLSEGLELALISKITRLSEAQLLEIKQAMNTSTNSE